MGIGREGTLGSAQGSLLRRWRFSRDLNEVGGRSLEVWRKNIPAARQTSAKARRQECVPGVFEQQQGGQGGYSRASK